MNGRISTKNGVEKGLNIVNMGTQFKFFLKLSEARISECFLAMQCIAQLFNTVNFSVIYC